MIVNLVVHVMKQLTFFPTKAGETDHEPTNNYDGWESGLQEPAVAEEVEPLIEPAHEPGQAPTVG